MEIWLLVKRIIATEGQTIDIDFQEGIVYIDGKAIDEPYINEPTVTRNTMQFPATVPEDHVFVMGDNRNHSADSRDASLGMVHKSCILGRVILRIFPIKPLYFLVTSYSRLLPVIKLPAKVRKAGCISVKSPP